MYQTKLTSDFKLTRMEQRNNGTRLKLKKKNSTHCAAFIIGATPAEPTMIDSGKRRKSEGGNYRNHGLHSRRSILSCCSFFKKSGVPQRLLFYKNGEWTDFPSDILGSVKKDFVEKNTCIEVKLNGHRYLLDFVHMLQWDMETESEQPIAWIDEAGRCFFPEIFASDDEAYGQHEGRGSGEASSSEPHAVKVQLEININGLEKPTLEEHDGDPDALVEGIQDDNGPASSPGDAAVKDSSNRQPTAKIKEHDQEGQARANEYENGKLDSNHVRRRFLEGMGSFGNLEILNVHRCSSPSLQVRAGLFEKQIEITGLCRGNANIQYAWLASSQEGIHKILTSGLGHCGPSASRPAVGVGVHLTPTSCAHISAKYCEADGNGERHMIFCRVILGNLEVVQRGSRQLHSSSLDYDTGVDNFQNPKRYIVWLTNVNTHIYPEYVVTFKMTSDNMEEGHLISGVVVPTAPTPALPGSQGQLQTESSAARAESSSRPGSSSSRFPSTPWVPFAVLFAPLSPEVSTRDKEVLKENYQLYQKGRMTRDNFVERLRSIVGDASLTAILPRLQAETQPEPANS